MSAESPAFTKQDRAIIRLEFTDRFWSPTSIHDGFWLGLWDTGQKRGQTKIPATVQSMIDRGLVRVVDDYRGLPRAVFTDAGFRALVAMVEDARTFPQSGRYTSLLVEIAKLRRTLSQNAG